MKSNRLRILTVCQLGLVACVSIYLPGTAFGQLTGFWHGVASEDWNEPPNELGSNWYDLAPPDGSPVPTPNTTAGFFPGAQRTTVQIKQPTTIGLMLFDAEVEPYTFQIASKLTINGSGGITNESTKTRPTMVIAADHGIHFQDAAILGPGNGPQIQNNIGGFIFFRGSSTAGNASISNRGPRSRVAFFDRSNGESVSITNSKRARVQFSRNSNPGSAEIVNSLNSIVDLSRTSGAAGNHEITALEIENAGQLRLGENQLSLATCVLKKTGKLSISSARDSVGTIRAKVARLGGKLVIDGSGFRTRRKTVILISATNLLSGEFDRVVLDRFPAGVEASIEYRGKQVALLIRRKD